MPLCSGERSRSWVASPRRDCHALLAMTESGRGDGYRNCQSVVEGSKSARQGGKGGGRRQNLVQLNRGLLHWSFAAMKDGRKGPRLQEDTGGSPQQKRILAIGQEGALIREFSSGVEVALDRF